MALINVGALAPDTEGIKFMVTIGLDCIISLAFWVLSYDFTFRKRSRLEETR